MHVIQAEQAKRRGLRNMRKIKPFVDVLAQYARVIEVFVNVKPDLLGLIWVSLSSSHKRAGGEQI